MSRKIPLIIQISNRTRIETVSQNQSKQFSIDIDIDDVLNVNHNQVDTDLSS